MFQSKRNQMVHATADASTGSTPPTLALGLDVYQLSGPINWTAVAEQGFSFVYAKATEGVTWDDKLFHAHAQGARKAGLKVGAYHYLSPNLVSAQDAQGQVTNFLNQVKGVAMDLPPALDIDGAGPHVSIPDPAGYASSALIWLEKIASHYDIQPTVYASPNTWRTYLTDISQQLSSYSYWLAEYGPAAHPASGAPEWTFWQYTDTGKLKGNPHNFDLDRFNGSASELAAFCRTFTG